MGIVLNLQSNMDRRFRDISETITETRTPKIREIRSYCKTHGKTQKINSDYEA